ncbi:Apolipoprotein Eb [Dissostichus eleginoides]|uniref:Apolipoprotein Eb n=1 Tax=Dissostichus eleginoides TaxID=100907 RepID=A0AAD9C4V3_DISEL|nr:Apolipoprotein Eb [Dissostichus eleginoides]
MKVLVVLVLAVFTGCNANILYADAPKPQIELLTEAFWDYVAKATETADEIKKSQFVEHVAYRLLDGYMLATYCFDAVQNHLPPAAKQRFHQVTRETEDLMGRVNRELAVALKPYTDDMEVQIQQRVEQLKQVLAPYAESLDTEALRAPWSRRARS